MPEKCALSHGSRVLVRDPRDSCRFWSPYVEKVCAVTQFRGPTVDKAIIVSRHVGRRYPTTNQRNTKMIVIMIIMTIVIIIIIIINIIMSMGLPNTPSRSKHAGGEPPNPHHATGGERGQPPKPTPEPHHTTGRGKPPTTTPHHTTGGVGQGGGNHWGGEGGGRPNRDHIYI